MGCWVGKPPGTVRLEGGFQNDACQHKCPCGRARFPKCLLSVCLSPGSIPVASYLSGRLSKISKWVWPRLLSNYYSVLIPEHVEILCVLFKSRVYFLRPSSSPVHKAPTPVFKARHSGGLFSQCRNPSLGSLMWGSNPLLLGENLCNCDYPLICVLPILEVWVLIILHLHPSCPSCCDFYFIS